MSEAVDNTIRFPGIVAQVETDVQYDWAQLGEILARGFDAEQADLLNSFSSALKDLGAQGLMQLEYVSDLIRSDSDWNKEAILWFLKELLARLED